MNILSKVFQDFRKGQNIDLYSIMAISLALALLNVLDVDIQKYVFPLILTAITLVAFALLRITDWIRQARLSAETPSASHVLRVDWSEQDIRYRIQTCNKLLLVGPILLRTTRNYYPYYEERLRQGAEIKVLVVNPQHISADIIAIRPYADIDIERTKRDMLATLQSWERLKSSTNGNVEIRTIDYPVSYGGYFFDTENHAGNIYLRYYPYKMRDMDRPRLILGASDSYWFDFYKREAQLLWSDAHPWHSAAS